MNPGDAERYARSRATPRSFALVEGRRIAYVRDGAGEPAVVLLSGAGMDIDAWFLVLPELASISTVVAIDRPGVGRSDKPSTTQAGEAVVATVREVLHQAGVAAPYVVVGHSLGGLLAELFARRHPDEVHGVVLVESASPREALAPARAGGVARLLMAVRDGLGRIGGRPRGPDELDVVETVRQMGAAPPFPDVPLVVVTGGKRMPFVPESAFAAHLDAQRERVSLSPTGRQVVAHRSGHFPQLHDPAVVVEAVRATLAP